MDISNVDQEYTSYPLEPNQFRFVEDACFWVRPPVVLYKIVANIVVIRAAGKEYYFRYNGQPLVINSDAGKIKFRTPPEEGLYNIPFLESVVYNPVHISLMGSAGPATLYNERIECEVTGKNIGIKLDYTNEFQCDCIQKINNVPVSREHIVLETDGCTQASAGAGQIILNDICKPPCYECNTRLTTGDVSVYMAELEERVRQLEP